MPSRQTGLYAAGGLLAVAAIAGGVYGVLATADEPEPPDPSDPRRTATPFILSGRTRPPTVPAGEAGLAADEPVIGVVAGGRARAYRVGAFTGVMNQVVNDVVGGEPVIVTRCERTGRSRVFTGEGGDPLPLMTGGMADGLLIKVGDWFYYHRDLQPFNDPRGPPFPYREAGFRETGWGEWRAAHPDTDVYVGSAGPAAKPGKGN